MASAFIFSERRILLMKRSENKELAAGKWAGVGGHVEPHEIVNPEEACLREIREETGIISSELSNFKLKYIVTRKKNDEIRLEFVYIGDTSVDKLSTTNEGELHWIDLDDVLNLDMPPSVWFTLEHYFQKGRYTDEIFAGVVDYSKDIPTVNWALL